MKHIILVLMSAALLLSEPKQLASREILQLGSLRNAIEKAEGEAAKKEARAAFDAKIAELRKKYNQGDNCTVPPHSAVWVCE